MFSIDPLTKIIIFFLWFIGTKKERRGDVLIKLGCGSKKGYIEKIKKIFSIFYFINIFNHSKVNRRAG